MAHPQQTDNPLRDYMREIGETPLLNREEEVALGKEIQKGSKDARAKLIQANLRLVVKIAHDFKGFGMPLSELISEGNIGLMRAAEKYDPTKGARFSSYGAWWIKQAMRRALSEVGPSRTIRVPNSASQKYRRLRTYEQKFEIDHGYPPSDSDITLALHISPRTLSRLRRLPRYHRSLDEQTGAEDDRPGYDTTANSDSDAASPLEQILGIEDYKILPELIKRLTPREELVILKRYGLYGQDSKTLEEVSKIIKRTRERVRQIEKQALRKLRIFIKDLHSGANMNVPAQLTPHETPESHVSYAPQGKRSTPGETDPIICNLYSNKRMLISQISEKVKLSPAQVRLALIRNGYVSPKIRQRYINALDAAEGNFRKAAAKLRVNPSVIYAEHAKYQALQHYLRAQAALTAGNSNASA